jgi:hypothetical protein
VSDIFAVSVDQVERDVDVDAELLTRGGVRRMLGRISESKLAWLIQKKVLLSHHTTGRLGHRLWLASDIREYLRERHVAEIAEREPDDEEIDDAFVAERLQPTGACCRWRRAGDYKFEVPDSDELAGAMHRLVCSGRNE